MKVKMSQRTFALLTSLELQVGGSSICAGTYPDTANGTIDNKLNNLFISVVFASAVVIVIANIAGAHMFGDERCFSHNQ